MVLILIDSSRVERDVPLYKNGPQTVEDTACEIEPGRIELPSPRYQHGAFPLDDGSLNKLCQWNSFDMNTGAKNRTQNESFGGFLPPSDTPVIYGS